MVMGVSTPKELRAHRRRVRLWPERHHPVVASFALAGRESLSVRVSDFITRFAGSMWFVYLHAVVFAVWCITGLFGRDPFPFNFLTLTVSLEAIFLSTFVMIGQNRSAAFATAKAEHDFSTEQQELHINTELTREIHLLSKEMKAHVENLVNREPKADEPRRDMPQLRESDLALPDDPPVDPSSHGVALLRPIDQGTASDPALG